MSSVVAAKPQHEGLCWFIMCAAERIRVFVLGVQIGASRQSVQTPESVVAFNPDELDRSIGLRSLDPLISACEM